MTVSEEYAELLEYSRNEILNVCERRKNEGLFDVLFAFVLSESGEMYSGKAFESSQPQFGFCAERHAINQMQYEETEKSEIKSMLIAGPVPKGSDHVVMPCGACRHAVNEFGNEETDIICTNFIRTEENWNLFEEMERFNPNQLYPEAYEPVEWE
jgi:Cytidine deaminase|nr:MAG: cytidine deaminase [Candidatus Nanosalinarum sp. J07AB56]